MAAEQFANNYSTTLNGAITAGATTLIVATAPPAALLNPQWRIVVESEIMLVTAIAGTTLTVTRGYEGTTAASHANGVAVDHVLTAGGLDNSPGPMTSTGDIAYLGAGGAVTRLPVGAAESIMTVVGGLPTYQVPPASSALMDTANGDATLTTSFVTLISRTITTRARPVLVVVSGAGTNAVSASSMISFQLLIDGVAVGGGSAVTRLDTTALNQDFIVAYSFLSQPLTAGSHSFSFQAKDSTANSTIYRSAGIGLHMGVVEIG